MNLDRVSVRLIDGDEDDRWARVVFSDVAFTVPADDVSFGGGVLRIRMPAVIDAPLSATVVERWLPPTEEQVRLAVEGLDAVVVERIMLREMDATAGDPMGVVARRAVALACAGDRGEGD